MASSQTTWIQRLTLAERVICLARPKISAKAPNTALIAPLAPTIGTVLGGSASHWRGRGGKGADQIEQDQRPRAEHPLDLRSRTTRSISMLKPRWTSSEWTSVALSGVRNAGSAADGAAGPLSRAGMKPIASAA